MSGQRLYCETLVRRRPRVTTTWTSTASLHEDDAKSVDERGGFGWCIVLGTRVKVVETHESVVSTHLSRWVSFSHVLKVAVTDFGQTNFALPHLTAIGWGSRDRKRDCKRQTRKKEVGQSISSMFCVKASQAEGDAFTRNLCPPVGFQPTFMSSIAGGLRVSGFRFLGFRFSGFWCQGLGKQGETKNYVKYGKMAKTLTHQLLAELVRPKSVAHSWQKSGKMPTVGLARIGLASWHNELGRCPCNPQGLVLRRFMRNRRDSMLQGLNGTGLQCSLV